MRNRAGYLLLLAILAGTVAAYLAYRFLRDPIGASAMARAPAESVVQVAVASRDLRVGSVVRPEDVRIVDWPGAALPGGYSRSAAEVVGRGLLTAVSMNEPLLSSKLALPEAGGGLSILIPEGKRAMSVRVDDVIGVAGFVVPGTRVDVLVTLDRTAGQEDPATQLILQNIEVMASGQSIQRDSRGEPQAATVVTLLVGPDEGERLALSSTNGRIQLALRNSMDLDSVNTAGIRASGLLLRPRPAPGPVVFRPRVAGPAPAPPPPSQFRVEVYRGPERTEATVGPGGL